MTILIYGFFGFLFASIISFLLVFYGKRRFAEKSPKRNRFLFLAGRGEFMIGIFLWSQAIAVSKQTASHT